MARYQARYVREIGVVWAGEGKQTNKAAALLSLRVRHSHCSRRKPKNRSRSSPRQLQKPTRVHDAPQSSLFLPLTLSLSTWQITTPLLRELARSNNKSIHEEPSNLSIDLSIYLPVISDPQLSQQS